jgi:hypothetical protein
VDHLLTKDTADQLVAIGTVISALFTAFAAIFAARAAREAARQLSLSREALKATTYAGVVELEGRIQFTQKLDYLRELSKAGRVPSIDDGKVREIVDHLNHVAHLIRYKYVGTQQMLLLYTPAIDLCRDTLLEKGSWLETLRGRYGSLMYRHFEDLCRYNVRSGDVQFTDGTYSHAKALEP